jgi:hypothetical protein
MKALSDKFEQVEFPLIGKVPVGLANAVIVYPALVGVGSLICCYYLGQSISKRSLLHRKIGKEFEFSYGTEMYPLWVEPFLAKRRDVFIRMLLFVSVPLTVLFVIPSLIHSIPLEQESIFNVPLNSLLMTSCYLGFVLATVGIIMVMVEAL